MNRSALRLSAKQRRLLLAEENPGKNDPESEESGESSSGGDGYHWLASSEIVMVVVSGQVVTSCLRRCKIFVTSKFPSGGRYAVRHGPTSAKESPCAGSVRPATGRQGKGETAARDGAADMVDYLSSRRTSFLGRTTHRVNSPRNAPAAAKASIFPPLEI